jgi:3-hydroxyisobutyrate dehydrogenase
MDHRTLAVLGTGIMGAPMARNAARAGLTVRAWNRTREKAEPLRADGIGVCDSAAEAVEGAGVVLTMLADGDAVASALESAAGGLERGAAWIQASTVGLEACAALAEVAERHGLGYLDAPVLGTKQPAEQGKLTILASGDEDARGSAEPVWDAIGAKTVWLGEAGAGSRTKLVMNSWVVALVEAVAETLAVARALDVPGERFLETIAGGPLDSDYAQVKGPAMLSGSFEPSFPLALARKDVELVLAAAAEAGLDLPLMRGVREGLHRAVQAGHGDEDIAATYAGLSSGG